jgi:hypothetical protein
MTPSKYLLDLTRIEAVAIWDGWILPEDEDRTSILSGCTIETVRAHSLLHQIRNTPTSGATYELAQEEIPFLLAVLKKVTRFISYNKHGGLRSPEWINNECHAVLGISSTELAELTGRIDRLAGG